MLNQNALNYIYKWYKNDNNEVNLFTPIYLCYLELNKQIHLLEVYYNYILLHMQISDEHSVVCAGRGGEVMDNSSPHHMAPAPDY